MAGRAGGERGERGRGEKGRERGEAKQINIFCTCVSYGLVSLFVLISLSVFFSLFRSTSLIFVLSLGYGVRGGEAMCDGT